jgi:hypothetical protein
MTIVTSGLPDLDRKLDTLEIEGILLGRVWVTVAGAGAPGLASETLGLPYHVS